MLVFSIQDYTFLLQKLQYLHFKHKPAQVVQAIGIIKKNPTIAPRSNDTSVGFSLLATATQ